MIAYSARFRNILSPLHQSLSDRVVLQAFESKGCIRCLSTEAQDAEQTTLVVGGGRGLGLEFVKQLLEKTQHR